MVLKALSMSLCVFRASRLSVKSEPVRMVARLQNVRPIQSLRDVKADSIGEGGRCDGAVEGVLLRTKAE